MKLEFVKINIHDCNDRAACPCDYLQIHNGFSENRNGNERICGAPRGRIIFYSIRETLKVQFVSDGDDTWSKLFEGFEATYTVLRYTPPSKYQLIVSRFQSSNKGVGFKNREPFCESHIQRRKTFPTVPLENTARKREGPNVT